MLTGVTLREVTDEGLLIVTAKGEERLIPADTIVTALPLSPNTRLLDELQGIAPEVHLIGDSKEPGLVVDAVAAGAAVARAL